MNPQVMFFQYMERIYIQGSSIGLSSMFHFGHWKGNVISGPFRKISLLGLTQDDF
jgi:hypothetical protein